MKQGSKLTFSFFGHQFQHGFKAVWQICQKKILVHWRSSFIYSFPAVLVKFVKDFFRLKSSYTMGTFPCIVPKFSFTSLPNPELLLPWCSMCPTVCLISSLCTILHFAFLMFTCMFIHTRLNTRANCNMKKPKKYSVIKNTRLIVRRIELRNQK